MNDCLKIKKCFLKQTNLIETTLKFILKQMIIKMIFNRLDFVNKKCKLVDYKENILKKLIIIDFRKSNKTMSIDKHKHRIRENSIL